MVYIYTWSHGPHLIARASSDLPCRRLPSPWVTPPWLWLKNCNGGTQRIGPFLHLDLDLEPSNFGAGGVNHQLFKRPTTQNHTNHHLNHHPITPSNFGEK